MRRSPTTKPVPGAAQACTRDACQRTTSHTGPALSAPHLLQLLLHAGLMTVCKKEAPDVRQAGQAAMLLQVENREDGHRVSVCSRLHHSAHLRLQQQPFTVRTALQRVSNAVMPDMPV